MILKAVTFMDMMWKNLLDGKAYLVLREKMLTDARSSRKKVCKLSTRLHSNRP